MSGDKRKLQDDLGDFSDDFSDDTDDPAGSASKAHRDQEREKILRSLASFKQKQRVLLDKFFNTHKDENGEYFTPQERYICRGRDWAKDPKKIRDAMDCFSQVGVLFVEFSEFDELQFTRYCMGLFDNLPFSDEFQFCVTKNMDTHDSKAQSNCFREFQKWNPMLKITQTFLQLNPLTCGAKLDIKNDADMRIIMRILRNPGNKLLQFMKQNGPPHSQFGTLGATAGTMGGPANAGNMANHVADDERIITLFTTLFFPMPWNFTNPDRIIGKGKGAGIENFAHQDISYETMKAQAKFMHDLLAENPGMTSSEAFLLMIRTMPEYIVQGKAMIGRVDILNSLAPHDQRMWSKIAKYQNRTLKEDYPKVSFLSQYKEKAVDDEVKSTLCRIRMPFTGAIFFTSTHGHGLQQPILAEEGVEPQSFFWGKYIGVKCRGGNMLSEEEIAKRVENLTKGEQEPLYPSGDKRHIYPRLASIVPKFIYSFYTKTEAALRAQVFRHKEKDDKPSYFRNKKGKIVGPQLDVLDYSKIKGAGLFYPMNPKDVDDFMPSTETGKMACGYQTTRLQSFEPFLPPDMLPGSDEAGPAASGAARGPARGSCGGVARAGGNDTAGTQQRSSCVPASLVKAWKAQCEHVNEVSDSDD